jgi:hypothetical protein
MARIVAGLLAGAVFGGCAWAGAGWANSELRLAPLLALCWCALALLPWRLERAADPLRPRSEPYSPAAPRAQAMLGAALGCSVYLPLHAAALAHDARLGAISAAAALVPLGLTWLAWTSAALAGVVVQGRVWHGVAGACALVAPLLSLAVSVGGAPQTGGAPGALVLIAACSPLQLLGDLARGAGEAQSPRGWVASMACAGFLVARQCFARPASSASRESA